MIGDPGLLAGSVPGWMLGLGALFPLKWMCQGLRGVFPPEPAKVLEQAGSRQFGAGRAGARGVVRRRAVLCLLTFRWKDRRGG